MAYDLKLAERLRTYLLQISDVQIEEKKAFGGLVFMVNGKMCVNVSGENLMCRYDPELQSEASSKKGFQKMIMRGKAMNGYCYVAPEGFKVKKDFEYWVNLCLDYNKKALPSKKKKAIK